MGKKYVEEPFGSVGGYGLKRRKESMEWVRGGGLAEMVILLKLNKPIRKLHPCLTASVLEVLTKR